MLQSLYTFHEYSGFSTWLSLDLKWYIYITKQIDCMETKRYSHPISMIFSKYVEIIRSVWSTKF